MVVHVRVVCARAFVWVSGRARVQLTDGTVCNELLCDNYGACWGKWREKKKSADEFGTVCVCVCVYV